VVDDLIFLDAPDKDSLVARQQNLLSGELRQQAGIAAPDGGESGYAALAKELLRTKAPAAEASPIQRLYRNCPNPAPRTRPEEALAKALRLVQAAPDDARRWVGLSDYYGDRSFKAVAGQAIKAIERDRKQPDAAFWLTSALWRKREMTYRIFHEANGQYRALIFNQ